MTKNRRIMEKAATDEQRDSIEQELWDYCDEMGSYEREVRKVSGVTINAAVLTDPRFARPGPEWRELDVWRVHGCE